MYTILENPGYVDETEESFDDFDAARSAMDELKAMTPWDGFDYADRFVVELWEEGERPDCGPIERLELQAAA